MKENDNNLSGSFGESFREIDTDDRRQMETGTYFFVFKGSWNVEKT